eukprot:CAMPEP_0182862542 /NCGR_PEP_ID=MMETSP0034_2-20130328/6125_1 /TAXON_ID=156128 /ORGANISM="Nephroselmis pyriformis, Strain CCMP717" /LENGTH=76 /DNA_ID=CAMNT_0024994619 /DNA_START=467 /DNA_END=697 /DNA_ORIENTATION=+
MSARMLTRTAGRVSQIPAHKHGPMPMPGGSYMARGATAQVGTSGTRCAPLPTTTPRSCDIACNPPAPVPNASAYRP